MLMLESGTLDQNVKDMYEAAQKLKTGKSEKVRKIINNAIDRDHRGRLSLNTAKPMFTETKDLGSQNTPWCCAAPHSCQTICYYV